MSDGISESVSALVEMIDGFSGGTLKHVDALSLALEHAHAMGRHAMLGEAAFQSNAVIRLLRSLRKEGLETGQTELLEHEFSRRVFEFHETLSQLMQGADDTQMKAFSATFLAVSHDALRNLINLAGDFSWLKEWERTMNDEGFPG